MVMYMWVIPNHCASSYQLIDRELSLVIYSTCNIIRFDMCAAEIFYGLYNRVSRDRTRSADNELTWTMFLRNHMLTHHCTKTTRL